MPYVPPNYKPGGGATSTNPYIISGVKGSTHARLEISELQSKYPEQFTLFIKAFGQIRKKEYQPVGGRFADLAGIHGAPYEKWSGDPAGSDKPAGDASKPSDQYWRGYCHHASVMFPT